MKRPGLAAYLGVRGWQARAEVLDYSLSLDLRFLLSRTSRSFTLRRPRLFRAQLLAEADG